MYFHEQNNNDIRLSLHCCNCTKKLNKISEKMSILALNYTFLGQNAKTQNLKFECNRKSSLIKQLFMKLGTRGTAV